MLRDLTSVQISEWEAYDRIDPIGSWRQDFLFAKLETCIINMVKSMYTEEGKDPKYTKIIDRMPAWREEDAIKVQEPKQSMEDMLFIMKAIAESNNSKKEYHRETPPKLLEDGNR